MTQFVLAPKPRVRVQAGRSIGDINTKGEGEWRPGPYWLPVTGGMLSAEAGQNLDWWQLGYDVESGGQRSAMIEACLGAYSQTVAMCPGSHWRLNTDGGRERVTSSSLSRVLKSPNDYQTISDFMLNTVRNLYQDGNAYALAVRNNRFEIIALHLMQSRQCSTHVAYDGSVFYALNGNAIVDRMLDYPAIVPARDVLHIRLNCSDMNQLKGDSPIVAAARDIAAGNAMAAQQLAFYLNQARPSTVLSTEMVLDKEQVDALRQRWNEQSRGLNAGGTPILTAGLKPTAMPSMNANDAQLAEIMKMSEQRIALAFRVPMQILGIGGTNFTSTESLMQSWLSTSLGFCLNHVEEAIGKLFGLGGYPDEYLEFDTSALLRSNFKERIEGLARSVTGGIFSINEARRSEGYPDVEYGDEPRVQQQLVPLSAAASIQAAQGIPGNDDTGSPIPPSPGPDSAPPAAPVGEDRSIDRTKLDMLLRGRSQLLATRSLRMIMASNRIRERAA